MHRTNTSTARSVAGQLQTSLCNVLEWYGTFSAHMQAAYQSTVYVLSQKARTV